MEFRIAETFTDSLAMLIGDEHKSVKTAAFEHQVNPAHSLQLHKIERPKNERFWSPRVKRARDRKRPKTKDSAGV
jgi:hypothetical protein